MSDFILKSTTGLLVFLVIYLLFLKNERMYRFNRFYLLLGVAFSLLIPFISIEITGKAPGEAIMLQAIHPEAPFPLQPDQVKTDYLPAFLWALYGLVTFALAFRFARNLHRLATAMRKSRILHCKGAKLVLTDQNTLPYTFLNTIFISRADYDQNAIEAELYAHELAHVRQKHSLDVLFIEIIRIAYWFNPLLLSYRKAIQLNHEFLADEKVLDCFGDISSYQNLLLSKIGAGPSYRFTSNLNYSITKKRFAMMTKTTRKSIGLIKKLTVIPAIIALILFFCLETKAQQFAGSVTKENPGNPQVTDAEYFAGVRFLLYEGPHNKLKINKLYGELTEKEKKEDFVMALYRPEPVKGMPKKSPTAAEFEKFKNPKIYEIWIDDVKVPNKKLERYKTVDIASYNGFYLSKERRKKLPGYFQYFLYTHAFYNAHKLGAPSLPLNKYPGDSITVRTFSKA